MIGEHTVQFLGKSVFAACKVYQSVNIVLYRPEILPSVAFADVWSIVVGFETFDKVPLVITRLHERGFRVIKISIVPGTFVECVRNVLFAHLLSHFGNAVIVEGIFQGFR